MATQLETKTETRMEIKERPETPQQLRVRLMREQMKLVRLRISCMNPQKSDLYGEIITVGNQYIGTVRKYVPFGEKTQEGWHVPQCIYEYLKNKKYLNIQSKDVRKDGQIKTETKAEFLPEFALEVLPPLTEQELEDLKLAQLRMGE